MGLSTRSCRSSASRRRRSRGVARCSRSRRSRCGCVKASFHAHEDGYAGIQQLAHDANLLFYGTEEAQRGPRGLQGEAHARLLAVPGALAAREAPRVRIWMMAARLRTLPAAVAPVLVGTALAHGTEATSDALAFVAALLGAIFIQVGTNLSNDYSDARRGADTEDRLGPVRVTAGGLVPPRQVLRRDVCRRFGLAVLVRRLPRSPSPAGCCSPSAPRRSSPACSTPAARGPTATRGSASSSSSCSSASSRSPAPTTCRSRTLPWEAFALAVPGRAARLGDPRRQQRPRSRDRPPRGQAHACGPRSGRERTRGLYAACLVAFAYRAGRRGPSALSAWLLLPWLALPLALRVVRRCPHADRRPVAQRRAGRDRAAPARVLRAAVRRDPAAA